MEFIDLHIHLQDYQVDSATDIVKKAPILGLKKLLCAATGPKDWDIVADWAIKYPDLVIPAFGVHPWKVAEVSADWQERLTSLLQCFPLSMVGEIGFDGCRAEQPKQRDFLAWQLALAKQMNRPAIVHEVRIGEHLNDLKKFYPPKFMVHSFGGDESRLREIIRQGGYVSFNHAILHRHNGNRIITIVPANRLVVESDGPHRPPVGENVSSPFFIPELIRKLAEIRNCPITDWAKQVYQNSKEFIYDR